MLERFSTRFPGPASLLACCALTCVLAGCGVAARHRESVSVRNALAAACTRARAVMIDYRAALAGSAIVTLPLRGAQNPTPAAAAIAALAPILKRARDFEREGQMPQGAERYIARFARALNYLRIDDAPSGVVAQRYLHRLAAPLTQAGDSYGLARCARLLQAPFGA